MLGHQVPAIISSQYVSVPGLEDESFKLELIQNKGFVPQQRISKHRSDESLLDIMQDGEHAFENAAGVAADGYSIDLHRVLKSLPRADFNHIGPAYRGQPRQGHRSDWYMPPSRRDSKEEYS